MPYLLLQKSVAFTTAKGVTIPVLDVKDDNPNLAALTKTVSKAHSHGPVPEDTYFIAEFSAHPQTIAHDFLTTIGVHPDNGDS